MRRIVFIAALVTLALAAAGIAIGARGFDDEQPLSGNALARASAVALAHTGGGRVTETEVGDEEGYYEVEVTLADGRQVDVRLDRAFDVLGAASDDEEPDDGDDEG